jgi:hypothetical protein
MMLRAIGPPIVPSPMNAMACDWIVMSVLLPVFIF